MKKTYLGLLLLALAGGCQNSNHTQWDPTLDGFFPDQETEMSAVTRIANTQAASGARNDAMLGRHHFDGAKLNSLGEAKLALMLKDDDSATPLIVYLNVNEKDNTAKQRQLAVATFLKDQGLRDSQIEVQFGDNPATRSPAAKHIAALGKTDTGTAAAIPSADAGGGGSPSTSDQGLAGAASATK